MTPLIADLMRWYRCTEEAAEYIARCAADHAAEMGEPLQNDLRSIAEAAGVPFFIDRVRRDGPMTLEEIQQIRTKAAELRRKVFAEEG